MLFKKSRAKVINSFVEAYEEYLKATKELRIETGWNFYANLRITSTVESEAERTELVKRLNEIEAKYNTK